MSMMFGYGWGCYCLGLSKVQIKLYWIIVLFLNFFMKSYVVVLFIITLLTKL